LCCLGFFSTVYRLAKILDRVNFSRKNALKEKLVFLTFEGLIYNYWLKGHLPVVVSIVFMFTMYSD